jgi:phosphoribosylanthranilate isomerase
MRGGREAMANVFVKLCGMRSLTDIAAAKAAGAQAVGINLVASSRRRVDAPLAESLAASAAPLQIVWVIDHSPPPELAEWLDAFAGSWVQQTDPGGRWPDALAKARRMAVVRLVDAEDVSGALGRDADYILSDAAGTAGGSGRRADWALSRDLARRFPRMLLAGGLTPDNIEEAIQTVRPFGVDTASGIEENGLPSRERMRAFVARARGVAKI